MYTQCPNQDHWDVLARFMKYSSGTIICIINCSGFLIILEDIRVNWITYSYETKFTSGYVFTLGGDVITWRSSKQKITIRSTIE